MINSSSAQSLDFKTFKRPTSPNSYLLCPPDYCDAATPDMISALYSLDTKTLYSYWSKMISKQPRVSLLHINHDKQQYLYVQKTKWIGFPDYIYVEFISVDDEHSQIAIYSHAYYGYYDFGVNKKRVEDWVNEFEKGLPYQAVPTFTKKSR